jgi:hypothetical protein
MVDITSIDFLKITRRWGKRAFSDGLLAELDSFQYPLEGV